MSDSLLASTALTVPCYGLIVLFRRWAMAGLFVAGSSVSTACTKNCIQEERVVNRLSGSMAVSTTSLHGSGTVVVDRLQSGTDTHPDGVAASFDASADTVEVDFFQNAYDIKAIALVLIDSSSPSGGTVKLCTCPADHPLMPASRALGGGDCQTTDPSAPNESIPQICETLEATISIVSRAPRVCQTVHESSACAEKLDVDVTVPAKTGAPFSGSFSVRHEIAAVVHSCGYPGN